MIFAIMYKYIGVKREDLAEMSFMTKAAKLELSKAFFLGEVSTFSVEFDKQIIARSVNIRP